MHGFVYSHADLVCHIHFQCIFSDTPSMLTPSSNFTPQKGLICVIQGPHIDQVDRGILVSVIIDTMEICFSFSVLICMTVLMQATVYCLLKDSLLLQI